MFGKNFLALRIAYIRYQLTNMVIGYFGSRSGHEVVYITKIPGQPNVSRRTPRIHRLTTSQGQLYAQEVKRYLDLKQEYDLYINEWNKLYRIPIPDYKFPLVNNDNPSMDYQKFLDAEEYCNPYPNNHPFAYDGKIFRSKNEGHVAKILKSKKLPYKVEPMVPVGMEFFGTPNCRYPDLMFASIEANKSCYIEVVGGLDVPKYKEDNRTKIIDYECAGYKDIRDIVTLYIHNEWDDDYIEGKINAALELMAPEV